MKIPTSQADSNPMPPTSLFVEQLTIIDSAWFCVERGLVGDSWLVDVELSGELNNEGMLLDFGEVKPLLKRQIDASFDHKLLLTSAQAAAGMQQSPDGLAVKLQTSSGALYSLQCPEVAVQTVAAQRLSCSDLAAALIESCQPLLPANITELNIKVYREEQAHSRYHYCHGLRQHEGNCQRIAHGHRARLEIYRNGERDTGIEIRWVDAWQDIFIGSKHDLQSDAAPGHLAFAYTAPQGYFRLELPQERCVLLEEQTTAECIANYIADQLQKQAPADAWQVRVFEGVHKGASASRTP